MPAKSKTVRVTRSGSGKTIDLKVGDQLEIALEGNPSTGYTWEVQSAGNGEVLQQTGKPEFQANSNLVGSGRVMVFTLNAIAAGQTNLALLYHRSWETHIPALDTYQIDIKVAR